jgi:hypothetical protein
MPNVLTGSARRPPATDKHRNATNDISLVMQRCPAARSISRFRLRRLKNDRAANAQLLSRLLYPQFCLDFCLETPRRCFAAHCRRGVSFKRKSSLKYLRTDLVDSRHHPHPSVFRAYNAITTARCSGYTMRKSDLRFDAHAPRGQSRDGRACLRSAYVTIIGAVSPHFDILVRWFGEPMQGNHNPIIALTNADHRAPAMTANPISP